MFFKKPLVDRSTVKIIRFLPSLSDETLWFHSDSPETAEPSCAVERTFLKIPQSFCWSLFLINLLGSNASDFLWTMRNFWVHLFWETSAKDCLRFVNYSIKNKIIKYTFFLQIFIKKQPRKPQNLKRMLRKSAASNAWVGIFKNAHFCWNYLNVTKLSKF